ncbi:hypothetical protein CPB85DRAFT_1375784 [Mucidula mucida]|nr:hypothetical protein CPB85DRAFT_1375784 [Mucidula mucida]
MPLLKKNNNKSMIPPVDSPSTGSRSSYRSNATTNLYQNDSPAPQDDIHRDRYNRNNGVGDVYSRGGGEVDKDRNELFAGYNPAKSQGSGRFFDGPGVGREPPPGEENDEDVEGIKQQTRFVKQESVNSSRNALRMALEAEETARNTMMKLGDQSEKLANTEMHLDVSKGHSTRASDRTDELKQLNRSIFRPVITFNKDAKRRAQELKVQERYEEERSERERAMLDIRDTRNRLGRAQTYGRGGEEEDDGEGITRPRYGRGASSEQSKAQRSRYQFEANASDDEMEDELDGNLDQIGDVTKRLKALGMTMGQELDSQNGRINNISDKTEGLDNKLFDVNRRQKKF